jgi:hypothetical protein
MRWWTKPALLGISLAALTALPIWLLPARIALVLMSLLLAAIAGIYIGIAIMARDRDLAEVETLLALLFLSAAAAGLLSSPMILALGYFFHGLWDLVHHPRYLRSPGPAWYVPLCVSYDWVVAVLIVLRFW